MSLAITKNTVVTLDYQVTSIDGSVVDDGAEPLVYLHGGYDDIFLKIEEALEGKAAGDKLDVTLEPDDAFGEYEADLVKVEPAELFEDGIEVGSQVEAEHDDILYTVTEIADGKVVLDGNHPLAGVALIFHITVASVRAAEHEEITHGHVHAPGHHHH